MLSGGYIYFYEHQSDIYSKEYFYIKGSSVNINEDETIQNTLHLKNLYGEECYLAFNNEKGLKDWERAIKSKIEELD